MKSTTAIIGGAAAAVVIAAGIYMIDIDQTQETRMPDVDVSVNGGQLPEFEAEVGSVSAEQEDVTVDVPDVEVTMEEKRLTVPTLEINPPSDDS
ncbi:hypothetical protein JQV19_15290 [Sulfitobacter mediterraneus]|uniref:hypothetical protein n=1 Tax=Sulfitobacter mediterraneus TaxID=83219 RepID=UPI0019394012|nr:hypothetical protein [Sulfitobacter mediterraneus]MBM1557639.1 hypothetical protein [Sulfitobacter mediterraneus]MBM1569368.1 hypothetical protein [Sulfitobacter mediterraneus]MBM1572812.1 hypothetical protein [Sulfitobacter mediterraneus]MBM1576975.1 hypothetical protein [Sulfitobacter mediterraneus]MBM1580525.1 hypothetical protein [Sulfitobacter mediterraneus]